MRLLTSNTFLTLDGVMQAPGGPEEDTSGGFKYGGWSFAYGDEMISEHLGEYMGKSFDLLLGRKTYEIFASYWPHQSADNHIAAPFNNARKYVASRTLGRVDWANSTLLKGDLADEVRALKEMDGPELQIHGSGDMIQTLLTAGLIDRINIMIYPITLGRGKRLFSQELPGVAWKLVEGKVSPNGIILAKYEPAGEVKAGLY